MQNIENQIKAKFKIYENIALFHDGFLYQLAHCPRKRTKVFRKLTYNEKRKAYYINGQLVSKKRLKKLKITCNQTKHSSNGKAQTSVWTFSANAENPITTTAILPT